MGKITYLENGRPSNAKMFLVYHVNEYKAIELPPNKTYREVLPKGVNFMRLMARNEADAIDKAKALYHEELLSQPI